MRATQDGTSRGGRANRSCDLSSCRARFLKALEGDDAHPGFGYAWRGPKVRYIRELGSAQCHSKTVCVTPLPSKRRSAVCAATIGLVALAAVSLGGCGGGGEQAPPAAVDSLKIAPVSPRVRVGKSAALNVTATDAEGAPIVPVPGTVEWTSSAPTVASVTPAGKLDGHRPGLAQLTATHQPSGRQASAFVRVSACSVDAIYVASSVPSMPWPVIHRLGIESDDERHSPGDEDEPRGVALDLQGRILWTDRRFHRVSRINGPDGSGRLDFGTRGSGVGQFQTPDAMAVDRFGRTYVSDTGNRRVVRFDDMSGSGWTELATGLSAMYGIFVDEGGRIYVTDWQRGEVRRYADMSDDAPDVMTGLSQPMGVCTDISGRIYVCEYGSNAVVRFDDMDGSGMMRYAPTGPLALERPYDIKVGADGRLYITVVLGVGVISVADMDGSGREEFSTGMYRPCCLFVR